LPYAFAAKLFPARWHKKRAPENRHPGTSKNAQTRKYVKLVMVLPVAKAYAYGVRVLLNSILLKRVYAITAV